MTCGAGTPAREKLADESRSFAQRRLNNTSSNVSSGLAERWMESENLKPLLFTKALRSGITVRLKAWGSSMAPAIRPGDVLTLEPADPATLAPGDIVLVSRDEIFVVHRLVQIIELSARPHLILRGDAMPQDDPPVHFSHLLGKVCAIERRPRLARRSAQIVSRLFKNAVERLAFASNSAGW